MTFLMDTLTIVLFMLVTGWAMGATYGLLLYRARWHNVRKQFIRLANNRRS